MAAVDVTSRVAKLNEQLAPEVTSRVAKLNEQLAPEVTSRVARLNEQLAHYIPPRETWNPADEALFLPTDLYQVPLAEAQECS